MTSRIPEPESGFEAEGIPDMGYTSTATEVTGMPAEGMEPPHDVAIAADDWGTTPFEEASGEPHDLRISREEPDVLAAIDQDADESPEVEQPFSERAGQGVGRLVEPDEGARTDGEADLVAQDVGTDLGGYTAEEAAMHLEPEV